VFEFLYSEALYRQIFRDFCVPLWVAAQNRSLKFPYIVQCICQTHSFWYVKCYFGVKYFVLFESFSGPIKYRSKVNNVHSAL